MTTLANRCKKFFLSVILFVLLLQLFYAGALLLVANQLAPYGARFVSITEAFFWPESLAFIEIAALNSAAFFSTDK